MAEAVKVVVRCRPMNSREQARGAKPLIRMSGSQTFLDPPEGNANANDKERKEPKAFTFDRSFWSAGDKSDESYASQQTLFDYLGLDILDHSFGGFNATLFAYGQTGSGKSYSMMGYGAERGIIPLTCEALFQRIAAETTDACSFRVQVSFIEIYNEKVRDLLNPNNKGNLKVREHPALGPYVEDLSKLAVSSFGEMEALMDEGNQARTVASTQMNATSSRSHSIFTIVLTQTKKDEMTGMQGEKASRISLVDLAGSERANSTGASGARLKEGANINRSLTTLGKVISALASVGATPAGKGKKSKEDFIPYRDSVLTWLLKDSLGGNSKTAMIAAVSPADYEETLSTLRYADAAKKIKNKATVNEDPNAKVIRELKEELLTLRTRLGSGSANESTWDPSIPPEQQLVTYQSSAGEIKQVSKADLQEQLEQSEKLMTEVNTTWEQKLDDAKVVQAEREQALEALGISIEKNNVGVHTPKKMAHLVNLNEDPLMSECLIYQIKPGKTVVGNLEGQKPADIRLSGENIQEEHCFFDTSETDGSVHLYALPQGITMVNGRRLDPDKPKLLKSGYRIIIGEWHTFRFNNPVEAQTKRDREKAKSSLVPESLRSPQAGMAETSFTDSPRRPSSPTESAAEGADWNYARREAVVARLNGTEVDLDTLGDQDLNSLFYDIQKVRGLRRGASMARPDSRMSYMESLPDEDEEEQSSTGSPSTRPFSGETWMTDDTSMSSSALQNGHRSAQARDEMNRHLEQQREEFEQRLKSASAAPATDMDTERQFMQAQVTDMQQEMQRKLEDQRRNFEVRLRKKGVYQSLETPELYTPLQERRVRWAVEKLRSLHRVKMAEEALVHAVALKEANVISRQLDKQVTYQFTVADRSPPISASGIFGSLADDCVDAHLQSCPKPCVAVKVLDAKHSTVYLWSLQHFRGQVDAMRNVFSFVDKPVYSQHLNWEEPFYTSSVPPHSFLGSAYLPMAQMSCNFDFAGDIEIISYHTGEAIGSCRVELKPKSLVLPPSSSQTSTPEQKSLSAIRVMDDSHLTYMLIVDGCRIYADLQVSAVHCQVQRSTWTADAAAEEIALSEAILVDGSGEADLRFYKELSFKMTPKLRRLMSTQCLPIDFFGSVQVPFLDSIKTWDAANTSSTSTSASHERHDTSRKPEVEMSIEQKHDVIARVSICELDSSGKYSPVPVTASGMLDPGSFFLRQGLQRRLVIELEHSSGRAWSWDSLQDVCLGDVRLLDTKGLVHASPSSETLSLKALRRKSATFNADGTSTITFTSPWDSSAHNSPFLDKPTGPSSRVLLRLFWHVKAAGCEPIPFSEDVGVTVQGRDARGPSKLLSTFSSTRILQNCSTLFSVKLKPRPLHDTADLWRRDTSKSYVRGEESLQGWKPHGVALVDLLEDKRAKQVRLASVFGTKAILDRTTGSHLLMPAFGQEDIEQNRLNKALSLWQSHVAASQRVKLFQHPMETEEAPRQQPKRSTSEKLVGSAVVVPKSTLNIKQSWLHVLRDPTSDDWSRRWFDLKRPYLYIHESSSANQLLGVINISSVRVDTSPEIVAVVGRPNTFAIYTAQNCYFLQAPSPQEMVSWMKSIDPGYRLDEASL